MDVLSDILRTLKLRGTVYFRAELRAPWGMQIPGTDFANFHIVARGECWLRVPEGAEPRCLREGDVLVFPRGESHELVHQPDAEAVPAQDLVEGGVREGSKGRELEAGGRGQATILVCGHFELDSKAAHPLLEALPSLVHVSPSERAQATLLETAARLAAAESSSRRQGAEVVVDRLAEVLLIQALRAYAEQPGIAPGFVAAIEDASVGRALGLLHRDPARSWSVEELAHACGVSRSAFADRFRDLVGQTPIRYLTHWRMLKARDLLLASASTIAQVATLVGYESEFAFARAFKRELGITPGALRRRAG